MPVNRVVHPAFIIFNHCLNGKIDNHVATKLWEEAIATTWQGLLVWVHGDISTGNLIINKGKLSAVIDFGQLAVGDPACDLAIAWTLFSGKSREAFCKKLIHLYEDRHRLSDKSKFTVSFSAKCEFKKIPIPTSEECHDDTF